MHELDCVFELNNEWHFFGRLEADVIPRVGENLQLWGPLPNDVKGRKIRHLLIGFRIEEVTYEIPPPRSESRDITVSLYSATRIAGGHLRIRDLVRDLLAEGWTVTNYADEDVTDPESIPDVTVDHKRDDV